ncbi:MAG: protein kinase [Planctomycetia bacterium]|nr:protein kinase [Planctomycetia bacterium]
MPSTTGQSWLRKLLNLSLISSEDWAKLPEERRESFQHCGDLHGLLEALVDANLLTNYQASRVSVGKTFGLILGNYRVLDRLGVGGMGVVYKAEHILMRRVAAVKVLSIEPDQDQALVARFLGEMRACAQLRHPNIVAAMDAGLTRSAKKDGLTLYYFVMEYLQGQDLESYVEKHGPLPVPRACDAIYQVASALEEAHKHHLVHRDIKPSNIFLTTDDEAKLLDFGLAMQFRNRMTEPGTVLGTVDYIAPEQAKDSTAVDVRADIYSLGGTLFFCLSGRTPFSSHGSLTKDLISRLTQNAPSVRSYRPEVPVELDEIIARMMALNPADRYATPQAVMRALLPFINAASSTRLPRAAVNGSSPALTPARPAAQTAVGHRVLIVDDDPGMRMLCQMALQAQELDCEVAPNGSTALEALATTPFDLVLLDYHMGGMNGLEVVRRLREDPPGPHLKIIMFSGHLSTDEMAKLLLAGVDDFMRKPFSIVELQARIKAALQHKDAEDRAEALNGQLLQINSELERNLSARDSDLVHTRNALVLSLAKLVEQRNTETGAHLMRIQRFCRNLADEAAQIPAFAPVIDRNYAEMLECCAPLHDIGKVALPDHILMKPGKLTPDERILMQEHTVIGAETLQAVARQHGTAVAFLGMAIDIARHHHERWDGTGYPDRLAGNAIPLSARLVALADVYDALRSRRVYKPALSHSASLEIMLRASDGQFDPALLPVLERCAPRWETIFRDLND